MDGLKHLLFRVIPLITLICFVCFGITYTFQQQDQTPITYLETNYYDKSNGFVIIDNPTEEQKEADTTLKVYEFNFTDYRNNINQNILKRAVEHTLTLEAYQWTLEQFDEIWQDGYQIFDVSKTIANGVVLIINTLILPINILLVPLRIIAGLLLTGMSIIGININNGIIITPILTFILDKLAVPFIAPNSLAPSQIADERWQFYENINEHWIGNQTIDVEFIIEQDINHVYDKIKIEQYSGSHVKMSYHIKGGNWTTIFDSGRTGNAWYNNYNKNSKIRLLTNSGLTQEQETTITTFLTNYATLLTN